MAKKAAKKAVYEYGGKEKYSSKAAEKKHERSEGKATEAREKRMWGKKKK